MSRTAYVDESEPDPRSGTAGVYVLAATLVEDDLVDEVRSRVVALRLPGQPKLHWHVETEKRRHFLVDQVAGLPARHLVVVRVDRNAGSERRRRLCLWRLLVELDAADVESVCLESRHRRQNDHDLQLLSVMRARRELGSALRMYHEPGPANALLWLPDVVAGAAGARYRGNDCFLDRLSARTTFYEA